MQRAYLAQNLIPLLRGKYEQSNLDYLKEQMNLSEGVRYIHISFDNIGALEEMSDEELRNMKNRLFENCLHFLGKNQKHCIQDIIGFEEDYEIGFVYCDQMAYEYGKSMEEFLEDLHRNVTQGSFALPVVLLVGKRVEDISKISRSYSSACVLRSFKGFRAAKRIY